MIDKEIVKIASNSENHGVLDNHTHFSKLKNSICGDVMQIYLIVKNDQITNFKYKCESCIYCQASVSLLSRSAKNKSIEKVKNLAEQAKNKIKNLEFKFKDYDPFFNINTEEDLEFAKKLSIKIKNEQK